MKQEFASVRWGIGLLALTYLFLLTGCGTPVALHEKTKEADASGKRINAPHPAKAWKVVEQPDLADAIAKAKPLKVEAVGACMKAVRRSGPIAANGEIGSGKGVIYAPNPDGKTYDIILTYFKRYGGPNELVIIDLGSGEVKQFKQPRYMNWHLTTYVNHPNGKTYIAVYMPNKHSINIYDPATNEFQMDAFDTPSTLHGETHPLCLGPDGKLYLIGSDSTEKTATACQIDVETGDVVDYGPIGPSHAPSGCWGYFAAVDERYIYIASGKVPWWLVAYDRQTGESKVLFETEKLGRIAETKWDNRPDGEPLPTASGIKILGDNDSEPKNFWLHLGTLIPRPDKKSPPPEGCEVKKLVVNLPPKPELFLKNAAPTSRDGHCEVWCRAPADAAAAPENPPANAKPEDLGWKVFRYKVDTYPLSSYRLRELPDGRIFGTAGSYLGHFTYDPEKKEFWQSGPYRLSHYATAIQNNVVYMSGYAHSPVYAWDLKKPWTLGLERGMPRQEEKNEEAPNPSLVTHLEKSGAHKMYGAAVGADGRIYFGGRWYRNGAGGGLGWWDPVKKEAGGFYEIFSNYQITHMTTAAEKRYIVISTLGVRDEHLGKPTPDTGRLFVYDTEKHEIARIIDPVPGCYAAGLVEGVGDGRVLGFTHHPKDENKSVLYGVDVESGKVLFRKEVPFALGFKIGTNQSQREDLFDYRLGPDGCVWTFIGPALARVHPEDANIEVMGLTDDGLAAPGRIAFIGNDIYLSGKEELRRCVGIVPKEP